MTSQPNSCPSLPAPACPALQRFAQCHRVATYDHQAADYRPKLTPSQSTPLMATPLDNSSHSQVRNLVVSDTALFSCDAIVNGVLSVATIESTADTVVFTHPVVVPRIVTCTIECPNGPIEFVNGIITSTQVTGTLYVCNVECAEGPEIVVGSTLNLCQRPLIVSQINPCVPSGDITVNGTLLVEGSVLATNPVVVVDPLGANGLSLVVPPGESPLVQIRKLNAVATSGVVASVAAGGEIDLTNTMTGQNLGAGAAMFSAKVNDTLQFRTLRNTDNTLTVSAIGSFVTINRTVPLYASAAASSLAVVADPSTYSPNPTPWTFSAGSNAVFLGSVVSLGTSFVWLLNYQLEIAPGSTDATFLEVYLLPVPSLPPAPQHLANMHPLIVGLTRPQSFTESFLVLGPVQLRVFLNSNASANFNLTLFQMTAQQLA